MACGGCETDIVLVDLKDKNKNKVGVGGGGKNENLRRICAHVKSSLTNIKYEDTFIVAASKDGSVSVIDFEKKR